MTYHASYHHLELGQSFVGPGRTLTETDLALYSMLFGDWHPIHVDSEFARATRFGQRIFHGGFGIGLALGMVANLIELEEPVVGLLDIRDWWFHYPLLIGQTMHVEVTILEKRVTSDGRRAIVDRAIALVGPNGAAQDGKSRFMVDLASARPPSPR